MPQFHLNLSNSTVSADDEKGVVVADLGEARDRAIAGIRGFLSHEVAKGTLDLRGRIDITDDRGASVMIVPFSDAVTVLRS
ncbi:MAG: hypothetical protein ABIQ43_05110 [Sphingomonas sp.]